MRRRLIVGIAIILSVFTMFSVSGATNLKREILGKWIEVTGRQQLEFLKDGTVIAVEKGMSAAGNYKFVDDNRLKIELGGLFGAKVFEVSIDKEGGLNLKEPTGEVNRYMTEKAFKVYKAKIEVQMQEEVDRQRKAAEDRIKAFVFSDLIVTDTVTKLMWTKNANIAGKDMAWDKANKFIQQLNEQKYAGYSDWRFPTKEELSTFPEIAKANGVQKEVIHDYFNNKGFINIQRLGYWSSTPAGKDTVYSVFIRNGYVNDVDKSLSYATRFVWPVRDGHNVTRFDTSENQKSETKSDILSVSTSRIYRFIKDTSLRLKPEVFASEYAAENISAGTLAEYIEDKDGGAWVKLRLQDGREGWTRGSFVELVKKSNAETEGEEKLKTSNVKKVILKKKGPMRTKAAITSDYVENEVSANTIGEYLGAENGLFGAKDYWIKVRLPNGKEGFFANRDVEIQGPN